MRVAACAIGAACLLGFAAPASGHGKRITTKPERGAVVAAPPGRVTLTLTEEPTDEAVMKVTDGCNRALPGHVVVSGKTVTVHLDKGRPGKYGVRWKVISAVDGHPTDGSFAFTVTGDRDCSEDKNPKGDSTDEPDDDTTTGDTAAPPADDDSSFPVVPLGLGAIGVIGIALAARFAGSR